MVGLTLLLLYRADFFFKNLLPRNLSPKRECGSKGVLIYNHRGDDVLLYRVLSRKVFSVRKIKNRNGKKNICTIKNEYLP